MADAPKKRSDPGDSESVATRAGGLPGATLRRVLEHIDTNVHRDPKLTELSALVHMSAFHFARLFKVSTGLPPHRFVVARRIEYAMGLLRDDCASIAVISPAVGFRTPSHFTTVFRRMTGTTPSAYRARVLAARPAPPSLQVVSGLADSC